MTPNAADPRNLYRHGVARVAACTHVSALANPPANVASILTLAREVSERGAALAVFPELSLSGYVPRRPNATQTEAWGGSPSSL